MNTFLKLLKEKCIALARVKPDVPLSLLSFLLILLSVCGRRLSDFLHLRAPALFHPAVALCGGLIVAASLVIFLKGLRERLIVSVAVCIAVLAVATKLIAVEESSHVVLFTLFGALAARRFGFLNGSVVAITMAGFDEGLQSFVPQRVFDVRDIVLNSISAVVTVTIYCWRRPK